MSGVLRLLTSGDTVSVSMYIIYFSYDFSDKHQKTQITIYIVFKYINQIRKKNMII